MKKLFCLICFFVQLTFNATGQQDQSPKLDISIGTGLSIPIGSYAHKNPTESAVHVNVTQVKGFSKEKNGFAKQGCNYIFELKYKLNSFLKILFFAGASTNPVETKVMSDFITEVVGQEIKVEENSYRFFYINSGIGYYHSISKYEFGLNLFGGYSITDFPYYKFVFLYPQIDPLIIFAHNGPRPNLKAFACGASLSAIYNVSNHFRIGIDALYQRANFAYTMSPELIPGGGGSNLTFSDILKARVINVGLKIGYSF